MVTRRTGAVAVLALGGCLATLSAQSSGRTSNLVGTAEKEDQTKITVAADATGDLGGYFTFTLQRDATNVVDGTWVFVNKRVNPDDGGEEELGLLEGTIVAGTVTLSSSGHVAAMKSLELRLASGTGAFEQVPGGAGTLDGTVAGSGFSGTLKLAF